MQLKVDIKQQTCVYQIWAMGRNDGTRLTMRVFVRVNLEIPISSRDKRRVIFWSMYKIKDQRSHCHQDDIGLELAVA